MSEEEKAIVRACLEEVELGMSEAREVRTWWTSLSEGKRQEWKDFASSVSAYRKALAEDFLNRTNPLTGEDRSDDGDERLW